MRTAALGRVSCSYGTLWLVLRFIHATHLRVLLVVLYVMLLLDVQAATSKSLVATTCLSAAIGCTMMALLANMPLILAPGVYKC